MTPRQKIMKAFYPLIMGAGKLFGSSSAHHNSSGILPKRSLYDLSFTTIDGKLQQMRQFKGKKLLLVNTASDCGYTGQYESLQQLQQQFPDKLVVIGFPANDFKEQEKGSDEDIAAFCKRNYGVSFLLSKKTVVLKKEGQHAIFNWLSDAGENGWCQKAPGWNFSKYLVNEEGVLVHYFDTKVSPLSDEIINAIKK